MSSRKVIRNSGSRPNEWRSVLKRRQIIIDDEAPPTKRMYVTVYTNEPERVQDISITISPDTGGSPGTDTSSVPGIFAHMPWATQHPNPTEDQLLPEPDRGAYMDSSIPSTSSMPVSVEHPAAEPFKNIIDEMYEYLRQAEDRAAQYFKMVTCPQEIKMNDEEYFYREDTRESLGIIINNAQTINSSMGQCLGCRKIGQMYACDRCGAQIFCSVICLKKSFDQHKYGCDIKPMMCEQAFKKERLCAKHDINRSIYNVSQSGEKLESLMSALDNFEVLDDRYN